MNKKGILTQEEFDAFVKASIDTNNIREYIDVSFESNFSELLASFATMFDDKEDIFYVIRDNNNNILSLHSLYRSREAFKQELPVSQTYILNRKFNIQYSIFIFFREVLGTSFISLVNICFYLYALISSGNHHAVYPLLITNKKT